MTNWVDGFFPVIADLDSSGGLLAVALCFSDAP
jgi:hypothetical protein